MHPQTSFFGTMGHGLDTFVEQELQSHKELNVTVSCRRTGKIFFHCPSNSFKKLLHIRTLERLFVEILQEQSPAVFKTSSSNSEFLNQVSSYLQSHPLPWQEASQTWSTLQSPANHPCEQQAVPKFRINCRITGQYRYGIHPQSMAASVGSYLTSTLGWVVDLRNYDLEIFVHLNDDFFVIGLPVTKKPLSERPYLRYLAVRSTICCAMASLAKITSSDLVLDPMSGAATILIEALTQYSAALAIGLDSDPVQLEKACENRTSAKLDHRLSLFQGDARHLSFRDSMFDVILCDVPFGLKFGTFERMPELFALIVPEMNRVLAQKGRVVILISQVLTLKFASMTEIFWTLQETWPVRLGVLPANMLLFAKICPITIHTE